MKITKNADASNDLNDRPLQLPIAYLAAQFLQASATSFSFAATIIGGTPAVLLTVIRALLDQSSS